MLFHAFRLSLTDSLRTFYQLLLHRFLCHRHYLVLHRQECCDVIHKNPQHQRRVKLCNLTLRILQHNAQKQATPHSDPGKMAVMVWSGSATRPSNCTGLSSSKVRDLVQKHRTTFRTLDHLNYPMLMQYFHLSFIIFINQVYPFCMVSSSSGCSHAFSQSAASNSATHQRFSASILPFDLIFSVISFMTISVASSFLLPCNLHACFVDDAGISFPHFFCFPPEDCLVRLSSLQ